MSLVSEALRKARREAEEKANRGVPRSRFFFGGGGPVNSRLGTGLVLGAVITFSAAMAGGLVAWWVIGDRHDSEPVVSAAPLVPSPVVDPEGAVATAAFGGEQDETPAAEGRLATDRDDVAASGTDEPMNSDPSVPGSGPLETGVQSPANRTSPPVAVETAGDSRDFVAEATLGDITLTLGYLVYRPTDPFVQINGIDFRVGSRIEGFVIDEITRDRVILHNDDGPVVIRVR